MELLVVIGIIAILAAVITVSAGAAINAAKKAKAANAANQIQTAIVNYYTEYGVYPLPSGQTTDLIEGANGVYDQNETDLMFALCGNIDAYQPAAPANNAGAVSNTRNIPFMTLKKSDVDTNGVVINPFSTSGAPVYFSIAMDGDYSGIIGDNPALAIPDFSQWTTGKTSTATVKLTQSAAVWTCCDPKYYNGQWANSTSPNQWVHTY